MDDRPNRARAIHHGDVVQQVATGAPRLCKHWARLANRGIQIDDDDDEVCRVCQVYALHDGDDANRDVATFLGRLLDFDRRHCLHCSDDFIVDVMVRTFNEKFLPRYEIARALQPANLPDLQPWRARDVYEHFVGDLRHDRSNTARTYRNMQLICETNVSELARRAWENDDAAADSSLIPADAAQRLLKDYMTLNVRLAQSLERASRQTRDEATAGQAVSGYGRTDAQIDGHMPNAFI